MNEGYFGAPIKVGGITREGFISDEELMVGGGDELEVWHY